MEYENKKIDFKKLVKDYGVENFNDFMEECFINPCQIYRMRELESYFSYNQLGVLDATEDSIRRGEFSSKDSFFIKDEYDELISFNDFVSYCLYVLNDLKSRKEYVNYLLRYRIMLEEDLKKYEEEE